MGRFLNYHRDEIVFGLIGLGVISVIVVLASMITTQDARLLKQCMDDGKKEYECVSMLRRDSPTVVHVVR